MLFFCAGRLAQSTCAGEEKGADNDIGSWNTEELPAHGHGVDTMCFGLYMLPTNHHF